MTTPREQLIADIKNDAQDMVKNAQEMSALYTPQMVAVEVDPNSWAAKKESSLQYTVPLLAQFEDIRGKAYNDGFGNYTVGMGSTVCPDGSEVTKSTIITSEEELMEFTKVHIEERIYPAMEKFLPVEQMSEQEIAAMVSLCYNCGAGVLGGKNGPTALAQNYTKYKETGERKYLDAAVTLMKQKNKVKGTPLNQLTNRRDFEARILTGEIILGHAPCEFPTIDLNEIAIGCVNTVGYRRRLPRDTDVLLKNMYKVPGDTVPEKIEKFKDQEQKNIKVAGRVGGR